MKKVKNLWWLLLILPLNAQQIEHNKSQNLQPTELEQAQLAKLKAQSDVFVQQLAQIDTQIQALNILKQSIQEHQQQKYSEFLGKANNIKEHHKEWGDISKIQYNPTQGESGTYTITVEEKKSEVKK